MKNIPYILAGLLLVVWLVIFLTPYTPPYVHTLLVGAAILILIPPLSKRGPDIKQTDSFDHPF